MPGLEQVRGPAAALRYFSEKALGKERRCAFEELEKMEKTKVNTPNGPADAMELEFKVKSEPWTTLELEDGTTLHVKINIGKVFRLEQYDHMTGEPAYLFTSNNLIRSQVPAKLKKFQTYPKATNQEVA
jgi:hypothetical protein